MKKNTLWIVLGIILLVELIVYFVWVSPLNGEIEDATSKLDKELRGLKSLAREGRNILTKDVVEDYRENRKALQKQYDDALKFLRNNVDSQGLKKWFPELNLPNWETLPTPAQFQSVYRDKLRALAEKCSENGIVVTDKDTYKLSTEENALVSQYQRFAQRPTETDTERMDQVSGFWEAKQLTPANLRTAQKQFWIQSAFVEALIAADGKQLVHVSFLREAQPAAPPKRGGEEEAIANAIDTHFDRIPVTILVKAPYGAISRLLYSLNISNINMEFRGLRVMKPQLAQIKTNPLPDIVEGVEYLPQDTNFVFPKIMDKNGGVNFGEQPKVREGSLPDQNQLLSEPAVLVELSYYVLDMKPEKPEQSK
jgi:hypothetical protein